MSDKPIGRCVECERELPLVDGLHCQGCIYWLQEQDDREEARAYLDAESRNQEPS